MFSRLATVAIPAFVLAAIAAAAPQSTGTSQCNTGNTQCCTQTYSTSDSTASEILGLLGVILGPVEALVGLGCTPITVIGTGSGADCTAQPVCCTGNQFNGLVNVGCTPINVNA